MSQSPRTPLSARDGQKFIERMNQSLQRERMAISRALEEEHERTLAELMLCITETSDLGSEITAPQENVVRKQDVPFDEAPVQSQEGQMKVPDAALTESKRPSQAKSGMGHSEMMRTVYKSNDAENKLRNQTLKVVPRSSNPLLKLAEQVSYSPWYELLFAVLIIANALCMAVEAQYLGTVNEQFLIPGALTWDVNVWPVIFVVLDWFFGIALSFECAIAMLAQRNQWFRKTLWNWFDFGVVILWMIPKFNVGGESIDPGILRIFRLLKLVRLLRLVRTIQYFDVLTLMVTSIRASLQVVLWVAITFFFMMLATSLIMQTLVESSLMSDMPEDERLILYTYFGTWSRSMLSMYEVTVGNWVPITRHLCELVSLWFLPAAMAYNIVVSFAFVTVIRGIFLFETFQVAAMDDELMIMRKERHAFRTIRKIQELFEEADKKGDGVLTKHEFLGVMQDVRVKTWLAAMDLDVQDAELLFELLDDGDQVITAPKLVRGFTRLKGSARNVEMIYLIKLVRAQHEELLKKHDAGQK